MPTDAPHLPERYSDARLVARGGMGEVWHARDTRLDRDVAIKLLSLGDGLESEATRRERFHRETRAIAQLSTHPGVVTIYDEGEVDGQPFQSMEWMPGGTLADRIVADDLREHELFDALERVAGALDAAHAAGIVHRDVKPGNVMFDAEGRARIGDFGIARRAGDPSVALTQVGAVVGTAGYIAPEQAQASGAVPESDQYALMSIAFQALTRRRPFERDSAIAELAAHVGDPIPAASSLDPRLPTSVDRVFDRALAKAPADRYASCTAAVHALRDALEPVAPTVPVAAVAHTKRAVTAAPVRTRHWPILLAVLAFAVIAAVAVASAGDEPTSKDDARDTTPEAPAETTTPEPTPEPGPVESTEVVDAPTDAERRDAAIAMHEESFRALQAGDYQRALELALAALPDLAGVSPYEAYANYNAGAALAALGRCDEALPYLDRSEQLQGQRDEIDAARDSCSGGKGKGKDKGRGDDDD